MHVLKGASPAFRVPESHPVDPEGSHLAGYLAEHLGPDLTAYVSGVDDEDLVARWIANEAAPEPLLLGRLRAMKAATRCLVSRYGDETARTWLAGMNPWLDDEAPGYVLRHSSDQETWDSVVAASKDFTAATPPMRRPRWRPQ